MTEETAQEQTQGRVIAWDVNRAAIAIVAEEMKDIDAAVDMKAAKEAKKKLVSMRTELTEYHKATKAEALAFGKLCDIEKNSLMELIRVIEDPIGEKIDEIKNAEARKEEARVTKIMAEIERIQAYSLDRHSLTLDELNERRETLLNTILDPELLEEYIEDAQLAKDEADLKLRLAIDREKTEIAEREEKAELERKNKALEAELEEARVANEERDRKQREYDEEQERVRKEAADAEAAEQRAIDDARQKELDDQQAEIDRQNKEREDAEQAERDREEQEKAEIEAQKIRDLQAPDVDKLAKYAEALEHLIGLHPVMGSNAGNAVLMHATNGLNAVHTRLTYDIEEMK